jgi:hypothetical protein
MPCCGKKVPLTEQALISLELPTFKGFEDTYLQECGVVSLRDWHLMFQDSMVESSSRVQKSQKKTPTALLQKPKNLHFTCFAE